MSNLVCRGCGKLMNSNYFYCPWCGQAKVIKETTDSIEQLYRLHKQRQNEQRLNQLEKMEEELDNLEKELSILVLSAEMHK